MLIHLDPDEILTKLNGGDRGIPQAEKWVEHNARPLGPVQANALLRHLWRK
jgi:hypothetical protein